jgi:hypothetical protein
MRWIFYDLHVFFKVLFTIEWCSCWVYVSCIAIRPVLSSLDTTQSAPVTVGGREHEGNIEAVDVLSDSLGTLQLTLMISVCVRGRQLRSGTAVSALHALISRLIAWLIDGGRLNFCSDIQFSALNQKCGLQELLWPELGSATSSASVATDG